MLYIMVTMQQIYPYKEEEMQICISISKGGLNFAMDLEWTI